MRGLADQDIRPRERLRERVAGRLDLTVGAPADEGALVDALGDASVLFATSRLPVTRRVLESSDLRVVAKIGTGVDNVDLEAAREAGVAVTYTPGANAMAVAEHTLALLLSVLGRARAASDLLAEGGWRDAFEPGRTLHGKTVGIVGYGNVGRRVATLLSGFRPTLLAHDPYVDEIDAEPAGTTLVALDRLLGESDAVTVNAELTPETRGMIDGDALAAMKPEAVLVNTARGPIVEEGALADAVRSGAIAGAGLDVFAEEPLPADSPLRDLPGVVLTPHVAAARLESRERCIDLLASNALSLLDGEPVPDRYLATERDPPWA